MINCFLGMAIYISCIKFTVVKVVFDGDLIKLGFGHTEWSTLALVAKQG